jgi:hypothetical protein
MLCSNEANPRILDDACADEPADEFEGELSNTMSFPVPQEISDCGLIELAINADGASLLCASSGDREQWRLPMTTVRRLWG